MQCYILVILVPRRQSQEDSEIQPNLGCITRPYLKQKRTEKAAEFSSAAEHVQNSMFNPMHYTNQVGAIEFCPQ